MGIFSSAFLSAFKPKPKLTISQWADQNRFLTSETSAVPGQWRTDFTPYLREPMDICAGGEYQQVVLMFASQTGKSEWLNNVSGYFMDQEPSPQLMVQPTLQTAKEYSQIRVSTMIKNSPVLRDKVIDEDRTIKGKDKPNLYYKPYPGGYYCLAGANSAPSLASKPVRILLRDEIDRFPDNIPGEGSPLDLSEQRTASFFNRLIIDSSTPLLKGASKIERRFEMSDQRYYNLPCPCCGVFQTITFDKSVKFDKHGTDYERAASAKIVCIHCDGVMKGAGRCDTAWLRQGYWQKTKDSHIAGFQISAMYSPMTSLSEIVLKWLTAVHERDEEKKQAFYNLQLGLPYEKHQVSDEDHQTIYKKRREYYKAELPDEVCLLTVGADVQDDRIEAELVGWAPGWESYGIEYAVFMGDPLKSKVWNDFDQWLMRRRSFAGGGTLAVSSTFIDSGGHATSEVYRFTKQRESRYVFSIKGHAREGAAYISKPVKSGNENATRFDLQVNAGKSKMWSRIHLETEGPGYCHFPREEERGYDEEYFKRFLSERFRFKGQGKGGSWVQIQKRNEPWDCRNYATAAAELLIKKVEDLELLSSKINRSGQRPAAEAVQQRRARKGSSGISL